MTGRRTPDPTPGEESRLRALLRLTADATPTGSAPAAAAAVRDRLRRRRLVRVTGAGVAVAGVAAASVLIATAGGSGPTPPVRQIGPYRLTGALVSFNGCDSYLGYVRQHAEKAVGPYGLSTGPYFKGLINDQVLRVPIAAPVATGAVGGAGVADTPAVPVPSPAPGFSTTNNQVAGVDEPDTVKTDGNLVVTLSGPTLRVLDTTAHVLGSLRLVGDTGGGLLLAGDRAIVLSGEYAPSGYRYGALVTFPTAQPAPIARVAVIDLSNPDQPTLLRTFLFDGAAVAARLVDGQVRLVLRSDGPRLDFQSPSESVTPHAAKHANRELVASSTLDDWLPAWQTQAPDGSTSARQRISSCDAIARPRHASGLSTVSVLSIDPGASAPGPATSVIAAGDTVYASTGHVYVAGATSTPLHKHGASGRPAVPCCIYQPARIQTRIYDFATTGNDPPTFIAAGAVPGTLLSSYAMDEDSAGRLRVASTTLDRHGRTDSRVTVLEVSGKTLTTLGTVDGLGHGQDLRAIRFVGDLAYVVTFRSFDPLYVVDLRDPAHPRVVGQLEQPGYNEFLYPLSADRLLGVGVQISRNEPSALLISTYDVSDPANPRRIDQHVLAKGFAAAESGFDPHAFLSWSDADLVVAAVPNGGGASAYRIGSDGSLTLVTTLSHDHLNPDRTLVLNNELWATTVSGVVTSPLPALNTNAWHPY